MEEVVLVIHLMLAVALVVLVLLQQSEGGALGIGGGQGAMMTSRGAGNFLTKMTTAIVACFFVTSLVLAWIAKQEASSLSVLDEAPAPAAEQTLPELELPDSGIPTNVPQN